MPELVVLKWEDIQTRIPKMGVPKGSKVWGIPRGGAIVAGLMGACGWASPVEDPNTADYVVDDILDSGSTRDRVQRLTGKPVKCLVDKRAENLIGVWVSLPWEGDPDRDIEDSIKRMLQFIGDDPNREGLLETPARLARSWREMFSGYKNGSVALKWFESESSGMVVVRGIDFWSTCEHHMLPFWGKADVGYIPNGRVIGVSKIPRLVDVKSRRLQIQERLTEEIGAEMSRGGVKGVGVVLRGRHMCMLVRGVRQQNATMETVYLHGVFKDDPTIRNEFVSGVRRTGEN